MIVKTTQVYDCGVDQYFRTFFDAEAREGWEKERGCLSFAILEHKNSGGEHFLRVEMHEPVNASKVVTKVFGDRTRVIEEFRWREGDSKAQVSYQPQTMGNRINLKGELSAEPIDGGERCRVTLEIDVTVKMFGVGKIAEKFLAKEIPSGQRAAAEAFNRRLRAKQQ